MTLDEFVEMVNTSGIVDDTFGSREINPLFNLSMMTQKNELDFDKHFNMTLTEFIEALGRVADKLSNLNDFFPEMPSVNPYNLDKKIESLLMILNRTCLPANVSE